MLRTVLLLALTFLPCASAEEGFVPLFDGKTPDGWDGLLIWQGGTVSDFELVVEYRVSEKGNSGIKYRSVVQGNVMKHFVNGVLMSEVEDLDPVKRVAEGLLGVQVRVGLPMVIGYRSMPLDRLGEQG